MPDPERPPKPPQAAVECYCGQPMRLKWGTHTRTWFYGCVAYPDCDGSHGAHQASGLPLGYAADPETRKWRKAAHVELDSLWKSGRLFRQQAYRWMQKTLGLTADQAHISRLDEAQCRRLIAEVHVFWDLPENQYFLSEAKHEYD